MTLHPSRTVGCALRTGIVSGAWDAPYTSFLLLGTLKVLVPVYVMVKLTEHGICLKLNADRW